MKDITQITTPPIILKIFNEIVNNQPVDLIEQFCARNFIFHSGVHFFHGLHRMGQALSDWIKTFPDCHHQINDAICQDERVVIHFLFMSHLRILTR